MLSQEKKQCSLHLYFLLAFLDLDDHMAVYFMVTTVAVISEHLVSYLFACCLHSGFKLLILSSASASAIV
jgi:hypothetical protein